MYVAEKHYNDFGPKNIALIVTVAVVLAALAWSQRPIRLAAINGGTSLETGLAADNSGGKVLGASQYNQDIIDQFEPINVATSTDNSKQAFLNYIDQVEIVKRADKVSLLLGGNVLQRSKEGQNKFISDLKAIAVPSVLVDYQKLLLAYYQLRFEQQTSLHPDQVAVYLSAVSEQLTQMRKDYARSAGIGLPE